MVIRQQSDNVEPLTVFLVEAQPRLERALVARFGINDGLDAASEAVAYALENWSRLEAMENPVGYLYRVGQTSGRRLAGRWRRLDALVAEPLSGDTVLDVDLQKALLRLKPDERVAIVLVHAHGHSYLEVADVLGVPVTTVANHLHRGLNHLRRIIG